MRVALGRKGDYAVRALLDLAAHEGSERRKAREIAAAMDIPDRYLTQILAELVAEGLLTAMAGPDGGYSLARGSETITLLDAVEAAEGPILLDECVLRGGACEWDEVCPIHVPWSRAQQALIAELSKTTFAMLAEVGHQLEDGTFLIPEDTPPHPKKRPRMGGRNGSD